MLPSPDGIVAMLDAKANDNTINPYEEKVIASNLLTTIRATGKVITIKKNVLLGTTELVLSNGIQVKLKFTDFKSDQILIEASRFGGVTNYSLKDKYSAENAANLLSSMGIGAFNPTDLNKTLAGKTVSLSPFISNYYSGFTGSSVKKDIETLFQLFTLCVTEPRKDTVLFNSILQRSKAQLMMLGADPQFAFKDTLIKVFYNNNPLAPSAIPKVDHYDKIDLDRCMAIYKERLGDLAGMHISIVGSFDEKEIIALLEKYVAGLPAKSPAAYVDNKLRPFIGENNFQFKRGKEEKSLIVGIMHGESTYSEVTALKLNALSDAMNILITEEMREKIQGIYDGRTAVLNEKIPYGHYQFELSLPCGPDKVDTLIRVFRQELKSIAEKGINRDYAYKVKKAWIEKYKVDVKSNEFWVKSLQEINRGEKSADRVLNAEKYYEKLTAEDIKEAAIIVQGSKTKLMAVQMPEEVKK
jgi:zinc protease